MYGVTFQCVLGRVSFIELLATINLYYMEYLTYQVFLLDNFHSGDRPVILLSQVGHRLLHRLSLDVDVKVGTKRQRNFEPGQIREFYCEQSPSNSKLILRIWASVGG